VPEEGAWIFVSHSHRDLVSVRRVRGALEAKGHQPLLFFLKCLGDDAEIDGLIRREIEARQFFLLCDSTNARESRWVRQEVALIKQLPRKVSLTVELEGDWETQLATIDELSRRATVFVSYHTVDEQIAKLIVKELRGRDFRVFFDIEEGLDSKADWQETIIRALIDAADYGYVLILLSPDALRSNWLAMNLKLITRRAEQLGAPLSVVPLIVKDREHTMSQTHDWLIRTGLYAWEFRPLDFTSGDVNDNMAELMRVLTT
jgi:hypothetical protein